MKKLVFLSFDNPLDRTSWSGTLFSEYSQLQKYYGIVWIPIKFNRLIVEIVKFTQRVKYVFTRKTYLLEYSSRFMSFLAGRKISKKLRGMDFDLIFAPCASTIIPYIKTAKPILYMSDAVFSRMVNFYFKDMNKKCLENGKFFERTTIEVSAASIFPSDWAKNGALEDYKADKNKVFMIPLGANIDIPDEVPMRKLDKDIHILFIGVDWNRKGGDVAVKTVMLLNKMQHEYTFILEAIGGKPDYPVDEKVIHLHGFIDKNLPEQLAEFNTIVNESYINILPTRAEALGIAPIEAAVYGLPTIIYDVGGTSTQVRDGINGYCLDLSCTENDFAEKVLTLVRNRNVYNEFSNNCRKLVKTLYNWSVWGGANAEYNRQYYIG